MLLSGHCDVFGVLDEPELSFVVRDIELKVVEVIGCPPPEAILKSVERLDGDVEVAAEVEATDHVAAVLRGWSIEPTTIHVLGRNALSDQPGGSVRLLSADDVGRLHHVPEELRTELGIVLGRGPVAATFIDERPVAFCSAASQTETLWDIGIDTLEPYRRRGHAAACVSFLIAHMRERNRDPVWGALDSNAASMGLARKLGFSPAGKIVVFEPPGS
jgi:GNAT superfamily N-acetyltransferase